ncbi:MAG TPA: Ig-like domain-containing protein, partial [Urbifossiella sp.]|nr:Ig-like domain-containing protein [Urbifossiella sp.]
MAGALVTPGGVVSTPVAVSTAPGRQAERPAGISYGAGSFLVVFDDFRTGANRVTGVRVTPAGALLDGPAPTGGIDVGGPAISAPSRPAAAFTGTEWVVAWGSGRITAARVLADGTVPFTGSLLTATGVGSQWDPALAFDGTNVLATWHGGTSSPRYAQLVNLVARPQTFTTFEDIAAAVPVGATDADGDPLTYVIVAPPAHGTLSGAGPAFTYTPAPNYSGPDGFTYRVNDGAADSNVAAVTLTVFPVNDSPVNSVPGPQVIDEDTTLRFSAAAGNAITVSDVDAFNNRLRVNVFVTSLNPLALPGTLWVGDLTGVTLDVYPNGSQSLYLSGTIPALNAALATLEYRPPADFNGPVQVTVAANDGGPVGPITPSWGSPYDTDTFAVTVAPVNDVPTLESTFNHSTAEDAPLVFTRPEWMTIGRDADGDALAVVLETGVQHGTLDLLPDGSYTYTPDANYFGPDGFTFRVTDGTAVSADVGTVDINVYAVNDPPVAGDDAFATDEEVPLSGNLFGNDSDPVEGDPLVYWTIAYYPVGGTIGTAPDGSFTYYPYPDYFGTDTFAYNAYDAFDGTYSNTAIVTITVAGTPDAPVAVGDGYAVAAGGTLVVAAPDGLVVNDFDIDQDAVGAVVEAGPAHGTLTLNADGSFEYTPDIAYSGIDTFTYRATDGTLESEPAAVEIVVGTQAVTTLLDVVDAGDGVVSLREAIEAANATPGPDLIGFSVRGFIDVAGPLPALSDATGGTAIVGYVPAGMPPAVGVRGPNAGDGFTITSAGNVIRGLMIGSFDTAIRISGPGASGNVIAGNSIGVMHDPERGAAADLTNWGAGIVIEDAPNNRVGSAGVDGRAGRNLIGYNQGGGVLVTGTGATGNVVAGNDIGGTRMTEEWAGFWDYHGFSNGGAGITIESVGNTVGGTGVDEDNLVVENGQGIVVRGAGAVGNRVVGNAVFNNYDTGVSIDNAPGTEVGGTAAGAGNVISANGNWGVFVTGADAAGTLILGNVIGTDPEGAGDYGNGNDGVYVLDAPGTVVGAPGAGNHIAANSGNGVRVEGATAAGTVIEANVIGVAFDPAGEVSLRNWAGGVVVTEAPATQIIGNLISGNTDGYGVWIEGLGSTNAVVRGNTIGTDSTGQFAIGNSSGVTVSGAPGAVVEDNLISGNENGLAVTIDGLFLFVVDESYAPYAHVRGNTIGTDSTGQFAIPNLDGVSVASAPAVQVLGNLISGNHYSAVFVSGYVGTSAVIQGNLIGTDRTGLLPIPNGDYGASSVVIDYQASAVVGGAGPGEGNVIGASAGYVEVVSATDRDVTIAGNMIGVGADGVTPLYGLSGGIEIFANYSFYTDPAVFVIGGSEPGAGNV